MHVKNFKVTTKRLEMQHRPSQVSGAGGGHEGQEIGLLNPIEGREREKKRKKYVRNEVKYFVNQDKCKWLKPIYQNT